MTQTSLIQLESPGVPTIGGFAISFPSGACKSVTWKSEVPIQDTLATAKQYAASVLQACLDERRIDDAERTNWASVTAAIQRIVQDWNEGARARLRGSQLSA
jgi:hypothetical protein